MVGIKPQPVKKTMGIPPGKAAQTTRSLVLSPNRSGEPRAIDVTKSKPPADQPAASAQRGHGRPAKSGAPDVGVRDLETDSNDLGALSVDDGDDDIELTDDLIEGYEDEYELSEELLEDGYDSMDDDGEDVLVEGSLALDEGALEPLSATASDSGGLTPPAQQMEVIPDGPLDSVQLELAAEGDEDPDGDDSLEVEGALLDGLEIEAAPVELEPEALDEQPEAGDEEPWTSLDDEGTDPFLERSDPNAVLDMPLVNPYSGNYTPVEAEEPVEEPLDLEPDEEGTRGQGEEAPLELEPDDAVALDGRGATGQETDLLMNEPDADWIDPMDAEDEVDWLREEAQRLSVDDQIDEELSVLDRLMRLVPGDTALAARYEDVLTRVIQVYFPGKTPDSIPVLTVEAWELPDLVRDPSMGAILSRMDGQTPLRDIYSVLPDQEPGTVYRLLSRAKGKGLVRLDQRD
jgi:hypothetical protein